MAGHPEKPRQACDNCRFRKVKCDRGQPCKNCDAGGLPCRYLHTICRKGPKEGRGRRQSQLRRGMAEFDSNCFQVLTRDGPLRPASDGSPSSNEASLQHIENVQPSLTPFESTRDAIPQPSSLTRRELPLDNPLLHAAHGRVLSLAVVAYVQLFLKYLFPIMPVVDGDELLSDAARLHDLPPSRYALIVALCAATRMQLGMDKVKPEGPELHVPADPGLTGDVLIKMAEGALRQYSVVDDRGLDSLLASFFLFASYGNMDNFRHAWFYLNQAIFLAQSLDLTSEAGYHDLPDVEREERRRIFWLLFVTERTVALQHRRSVTLRGSITKPQVIDSNCPVVMNDFINHIRLFESLPWSLYEWQPESDKHQLKHLNLAHTINDKLCNVQPDQSVIPSQRFDTLITQQWLRISMWRLTFGKKPSSSCNNFGLLLPPALPIDAGKIIMSALSSAGPHSKDCHGIGMEQKLFDVGLSLADSAMLPGLSCSSFETSPRELLYAVIGALSVARGTQSHLLPNLLKYSEGVLAFAGPTPHIDYSLEWPREDLNPIQEAVVEDVSGQNDEAVDSLNWLAGDDSGLLDLGTPVATPSWEGATLPGEQTEAEVRPFSARVHR
ncbi:transcription activator amyR [Lipomyces tetrasporus]|uniref:Transcription activator amyR n=1 Tax=Lipomyces tetrasporus TaxID=54092 RepID=A0AAD7QT39_9ASCO|nr:transcription activator amyR [Lipomyces tetrasporus]KAJ8100844.1 transcription activator amyR [Lipomyces tetrasporus]